MDAHFADRLRAERSTRRQKWQLARELQDVDDVLKCVRPPNPRCSDAAFAAFVHSHHVVAAVRDRLRQAAVHAATRQQRAQELLDGLLDQAN